MIKVLKFNKRNWIKLFSTELKKVESTTKENTLETDEGPKVENVGTEKVKIKISRIDPEEEPKFKQQVEEKPIQIGENKTNDLFDLIALALSGLFFGFVAFLYTKRNIETEFKEIYHNVKDIQERKTLDEMEDEFFREQEENVIRLIQTRRKAKDFVPPEIKFEDYFMILVKRYWNEVLWTIGQQISRSNERKRIREEEKLEKRINDEISSLGFDPKNVAVKKVYKS